MKNKIVLLALAAVSVASLSACNTGSASKPGADSTGHYSATNPYRDTFPTTNTYGNASTTDNSGSGGVDLAKPQGSMTTEATSVDDLPPAPPVPGADTAKVGVPAPVVK